MKEIKRILKEQKKEEIYQEFAYFLGSDFEKKGRKNSKKFVFIVKLIINNTIVDWMNFIWEFGDNYKHNS